MAHIYSKATALSGVLLARAYEEILTGPSGNAYVGIGKSSQWENGDVPPIAVETVEEYNNIFRNLIALKRINSSDVNLVIPDISWNANVVYDQYNSDEEMYEHVSTTLLAGRIDYVSGNVIVANNNSTLFLSDLSTGDVIELVDQYTTDEIRIRREIVSITNSYHAIINTSISAAYSNVQISRIDDYYPKYAKQFYVRNSVDQVFLCLFNNGNTPSNTQPVFSEPYSLDNLITDTPDGYVWRYLYTVPSGLVDKFFWTDDYDIRWLPVVADAAANVAIDGSIEHIRILNGGTVYNSNTPCTSIDIITIDGDGINAIYTANVAASIAIDNKTTIKSLIKANSGSGYTYANITAEGGDGGAEFKALISPVDGFGYDPAKDLGAKFLGISIEFEGSVSNAVPVSTSIGGVQFRQASVINNIKYANNVFVDVSSRAMTTNVEVAYSGSVSIGATVNVDSVPVATVVGFNNPYMLLNNVTDNSFDAAFTIGSESGAFVRIVSEPEVKRSGDILYLENFDPVTRLNDQAEVIRLVLKF